MPANVDKTYVIRRPLLSEKGTWAMNEQERYTFDVDPRATKEEIKSAIEAIYKVKIVGINTSVRKGKSQRTKFGPMELSATKKATVRLKSGDKIELF
jgi:large subunit ribosomal protein L23